MPQVLTSLDRLLPWLQERGIGRLLVVCDPVVRKLPLRQELNALPLPCVWIDEVRPNPRYEDICAAVSLFCQEGCDGILAVGGGSAIDTAKCIKLWCRETPGEVPFLRRPYGDTGVPLAAIPTTAGTGSEATHYAVIYYEGVKQSVAHKSLRPDAALLLPSLLDTLPPYQKKATLSDALCQAIESFWALSATEESRAFASSAIRRILTHKDAYLTGDSAVNGEIQQAAYEAGCAIDITATTAAHAMSYKLTSLYGLAHGHAVGLCMTALWPYMCAHTQDTRLPGGQAAQQAVFDRLAALFAASDAAEAAARYIAFFDSLALPAPPQVTDAELDLLAASVNPERLGNNPVLLSEETLRQLYARCVNGTKRT